MQKKNHLNTNDIVPIHIVYASSGTRISFMDDSLRSYNSNVNNMWDRLKIEVCNNVSHKISVMELKSLTEVLFSTYPKYVFVCQPTAISSKLPKTQVPFCCENLSSCHDQKG